MKYMAALLAITALSGCATTADQAARKDEVIRTAPTCSGEADCSAKWETAQLWVAKHAAYKIQTVTNVLIQTYNPDATSTYLAAVAVKEPLGGGAYVIHVNLWCNNLFGCTPDRYEAMMAFNIAVANAKP